MLRYFYVLFPYSLVALDVKTFKQKINCFNTEPIVLQDKKVFSWINNYKLIYYIKNTLFTDKINVLNQKNAVFIHINFVCCCIYLYINPPNYQLKLQDHFLIRSLTIHRENSTSVNIFETSSSNCL